MHSGEPESCSSDARVAWLWEDEEKAVSLEGPERVYGKEFSQEE